MKPITETGWTNKVREFISKLPNELPSKPLFMSETGKQHLQRMILDELQELRIAEDEDQQADALVDIIYYVLDRAVRQGYNLDPLFDIVHDANMRKVLPDGTLMLETEGPRKGKILKPEGWYPPDMEIAKEISTQMEFGSWFREDALREKNVHHVPPTRLVFLGQPYSGDAGLMESRYLAARYAFAALTNRGELVFSPILSAHKAAMAHDLPTDAAFWFEWNYQYLAVADKLYVLMLAGWEESVGLKREIKEFAAIRGSDHIWYVDPGNNYAISSTPTGSS